MTTGGNRGLEALRNMEMEAANYKERKKAEEKKRHGYIMKLEKEYAAC